MSHHRRWQNIVTLNGVEVAQAIDSAIQSCTTIIFPPSLSLLFPSSHLFAFSYTALRLLVGQQEGHPACKKTVIGCGMVMGMGTDLMMPLPLTISCSRISRLVLPFWCRLTQVILDKIQEGRKVVVCGGGGESGCGYAASFASSGWHCLYIVVYHKSRCTYRPNMCNGEHLPCCCNIFGDLDCSAFSTHAMRTNTECIQWVFNSHDRQVGHCSLHIHCQLPPVGNAVTIM